MKSIKESIIGKRGSNPNMAPKDLRPSDIVQLENGEYRMIADDYFNRNHSLCLCCIPSRGTYNLDWYMLSAYGDSMDIGHKSGWYGKSIVKVWRTDVKKYEEWAAHKLNDDYVDHFEERWLQKYTESGDYKLIWEAK